MEKEVQRYLSLVGDTNLKSPAAYIAIKGDTDLPQNSMGLWEKGVINLVLDPYD
jgi:hypothetical protein